jgi:hypothetical protein
VELAFAHMAGDLGYAFDGVGVFAGKAEAEENGEYGCREEGEQ